MRAAFARLGRGDRELLELRVVAGLTAEEVGKVLGKRPGRSGWRRHGRWSGCVASWSAGREQGERRAAPRPARRRPGRDADGTEPGRDRRVRGSWSVSTATSTSSPRSTGATGAVDGSATRSWPLRVVVGLVVAGGTRGLVGRRPGPTGPSASVSAPGLPRESRDRTAARLAMSELRAASAGPDDARVAQARDRLQRALARLDPADRAALAVEVAQLVERADARLARRLGVHPLTRHRRPTRPSRPPTTRSPRPEGVSRRLRRHPYRPSRSTRTRARRPRSRPRNHPRPSRRNPRNRPIPEGRPAGTEGKSSRDPAKLGVTNVALLPMERVSAQNALVPPPPERRSHGTT